MYDRIEGREQEVSRKSFLHVPSIFRKRLPESSKAIDHMILIPYDIKTSKLEVEHSDIKILFTSAGFSQVTNPGHSSYHWLLKLNINKVIIITGLIHLNFLWLF